MCFSWRANLSPLFAFSMLLCRFDLEASLSNLSRSQSISILENFVRYPLFGFVWHFIIPFLTKNAILTVLTVRRNVTVVVCCWGSRTDLRPAPDLTGAPRFAFSHWMIGIGWSLVPMFQNLIWEFLFSWIDGFGCVGYRNSSNGLKMCRKMASPGRRPLLFFQIIQLRTAFCFGSSQKNSFFKHP